jgi:ABC-type branched-subunit amino acid transport system substrate-binding protein
VVQILRLALLCLCAALASPAYADITIGHVLSLTGPGAETARQLSVGAKVYIDRVNAAGGMAGHKVIYLVRDDAGLPDQTLIRTGELIARDNVYGLLEGTSPAKVEALVSSGVLRQHNVAMLGIKGGLGSPYPMEGSRKAGLVEIVPPQYYVAPVLEEFRAALAKYGPPGETYSSAALQGYIAAKVLVGAIRMLPPAPTRADFYDVMQHMIPDLANRLAMSTQIPQ